MEVWGGGEEEVVEVSLSVQTSVSHRKYTTHNATVLTVLLTQQWQDQAAAGGSDIFKINLRIMISQLGSRN